MNKTPLHIVREVERVAASSPSGKVSLGELLERVARRALGPFILIPGLLMVSPVAGVPAVPSMLALIVVLASAQLAWGREELWLPSWLKRHKFKSETLRTFAVRAKPWAMRLGRIFKPRWPSLFTCATVRVVGLLAILIALSVPPLEFLPLAALLPGLLLVLLGIALTVHDGLVLSVALTLALGMGLVGVWSYLC